MNFTYFSYVMKYYSSFDHFEPFEKNVKILATKQNVCLMFPVGTAADPWYGGEKVLGTHKFD